MWSLSHTCHVGNQVSSPNRTKKVKKLIKPSNAHLPTSCYSISHSWLLLKENHTSLCVFVAGKKRFADPFLDLQNSRQALASKKAILASHHFSTGAKDSKGWKKQPPNTPGVAAKDKDVGHLPLSTRFFAFIISHQGTNLDTATLICAMGPSRRNAFATIVTMPLQTRLTMRVLMYCNDCRLPMDHGTLNDPPFRGFARQSLNLQRTSVIGSR